MQGDGETYLVGNTCNESNLQSEYEFEDKFRACAFYIKQDVDGTVNRDSDYFFKKEGVTY